MKKLMTLMLGMMFVFGSTVAFAGQNGGTKKTAKKKPGKKKGSQKKGSSH